MKCSTFHFCVHHRLFLQLVCLQTLIWQIKLPVLPIDANVINNSDLLQQLIM